MDAKQLYFSLPPLTRYYLTIIFLLAFNLTYMPQFLIVQHLILDYNKIFHKLQIWRLFTNLLIIGPFSTGFLFFCFFFYSNVRSLEIQAIKLRRYAEFIMMLFYITLSLNLINIITTYYFGFRSNFTLAHQLLYALVYIDSKREPQKNVMIYFITIKNCYVPYAFLLFSLITGGSIIENIIGIVAGHIYFFFKEIAPIQNGIDLLKTPKFLVDLSEKYITDPEDNVNNNMNQQRGNNYYSGYGFSGVINRGNRNNNNNNNNTGFRAFQGHGTQLG